MQTRSPDVIEATGSMGQCLMWLMELLVGGPGIMNVPVIYRMRGPLDVPALSKALTAVVDRHEGLRTAFTWDWSRNLLPDMLTQHISPSAGVSIECTDVSGEPSPYETAYRRIYDRLVQNIDVTSGAPFVVDLFRLDAEDHLLMITIHHIITDAWSNMLICRDLGEFYNRQAGAPENALEPVQWSYQHYARWQKEKVVPPYDEDHRKFWHERLTKAKYLDLRRAPEREGGKMPPSRNVWFAIAGPHIDRLREFAKCERTTLFVVMLTLFYCVLHAASGERELTVGSVFANRPRRELYNTVGCFANLVALVTELPEEATVAAAVRVVRRTVLEALAHQDYPYLSAVAPDTTMPSSAIRASEVVFHMLAIPEKVSPPAGIAFSGLQVESHPIPDGMASRFDLELLIIPQIGMLEGTYRYAGDRYERDFIEQLANCYTKLVEAVAADPATPIPAAL